MAYKYYQPNEKAEKKMGDCVIRALCKAYNLTWLEAFRELIPYAEAIQDMPNSKKVYSKYIKDKGGCWNGIKVEKGQKRMTVKELAKYTRGTHIARLANHIVCIIDGDWYDSWDSGNKTVYGHWEIRH